MPQIRRSAHLDVPLALAFDALKDTLQNISARAGAWEGFALHADFADASLPDAGYIAIPIALEVGPREDGLYQLNVTFRALRHPEAFPAFTGAFGVDSTGPTGVSIWLAGAYDVPMSAFGTIANATLLRGIAESALANLLDDVAVAVRARVEKNEARYVRYRTFAY